MKNNQTKTKYHHPQHVRTKKIISKKTKKKNQKKQKFRHLVMIRKVIKLAKKKTTTN